MCVRVCVCTRVRVCVLLHIIVMIVMNVYKSPAGGELIKVAKHLIVTQS